AAARRALGEAHRVKTAWPGLPASVLVDEIQQWWDERRGSWARRIHGFYRTIGQGVVRPIKRLWNGPTGPADPLAAYCEREQSVIVEGLGRLLEELERLASV